MMPSLGDVKTTQILLVAWIFEPGCKRHVAVLYMRHHTTRTTPQKHLLAMHGRRSRTSFVNSWFLKECLVWLYRVFLAFVEDGFDILFDAAFSGCLRQSFLEHFDLLIPKVCIANDRSRWLRPITRTARMKANQRIWICILPYVPFCQLVLVNIWVFLNFYSAIIVSLIDSAFSGCRIETWKQFVFLGCSCIIVGRYPHSVASNDSFSGCWNHLRVFAT